MANKTKLADNTFEDMVDFAVSEILQQFCGGKRDSLRSTMHWIVDVTARWGKETHQQQEKHELSKRRRRCKN